MISVYQLKPRFQACLRPLTQWLYQRGVTANQVTLAACAFSIVIAVIVALGIPHYWIFWAIPLWMFLRMALNAIDGMLAREFGQQSHLGAWLNELCDVISDAAVFAVFALLPGVCAALVMLLIFLSCLSEYAGAMGPLAGASRRYDGPMGKSDRALVFGFLAAGIASGLLPFSWINPALLIVTALLIYTTCNRIRNGVKEARQKTCPDGKE